MAPLFVLLIAFLLLWGLGRLGVRGLASGRDSGRVALAVMFLFTGASHFSSMKYDLLAMIPNPLPRGLWVIYATGALEIAGAIGLLIPRLRRLAAVCLALLLVALFPANVYAALQDIPLRGKPPTPLWLRAPMQLFWIGMLWWTTIRAGKDAAEASTSVRTDEASGSALA